MRYTSARMVSATVFSGDMKGSLLYDSTQALNLGTSAATSHALGTGDVLVGGDLEVDGDIYADSSMIFEGTTTFTKGLISFSATNSIIQTADRVGGVKTLDLDIRTGNQTNAADVPTGEIAIYTGATTTDGDTGDITLYTGAAGAGAVDAGDIVLGVNGAPGIGTTALTIEGATGALKVPAYEVDYVIPAGSVVLGPTAPTFEVNGLVGGLGFNADAEAVYLNFEIPSSWDGASDLKLKVYWVAESGDAPQLNETVKWDFQYRSIVWGTEDADNGTSVTATTTYTETADPGDDQATHITEITLDFDNANQPLTAGDVITGRFDRDVTTDTYSGLGIVHHWEVEVQEDKLLRDHL